MVRLSIHLSVCPFVCLHFLQEDSRVQARDEEEKRKEIAEKFQSTIDDITVRMQEHHDRNLELKQENTE